jgi:hypothetical protein
MTDASIFNGESTNDTTTPAATTDGQLFPALVGDNQKYKTPEDLAKAYSNADQFIEQLKEENRKLREQTVSAKTIDDVLERMSKQKEVPEYDNSPAQEFNPDIVQQLVEKTLAGREQSQLKNNNLLKADQLMKDKFGSKALEIFSQRANTPEKVKVLMELAAIDPIEFASMFAGTPSVTNNMDSGSMNTTSVPSTGGNRAGIEGTKEWAAKVRAENPSQYWSQEFQYKLQQTVTKNPTLYFGGQ